MCDHPGKPKIVDRLWVSAPIGAPLSGRMRAGFGARCTSGKVKRMKRWEHEAALEATQRRLGALPDAMAVRRETAGHAFGVPKACTGAISVLASGLRNVRTEMSLAVLAYNTKRMSRLSGTSQLIRA